MTGNCHLYTALVKLKEDIRNSGLQQVRVLTYAGRFEAQRDDRGRSADFDAYLGYASANPALHRVATSTIDALTAASTTESTSQLPEGMVQFHSKILHSTIALAKRLIILRLTLR